MPWTRWLVFSAITLGITLWGAEVRPWLVANAWVLGIAALGLLGGLWVYGRRINLRWRDGVELGIATAVIMAVATVALSIEWRGPRSIELWHLVVYTAGGFWIRRRWQVRPILPGVLVLGIATSTVNELLQAMMVQRFGDVRDVLMDLMAWGVGVLWASRLAPSPTLHPMRLATAVVLVLIAGGVFYPGTRWLVGFFCHPYPPDTPRVCLPSGYRNPPPGPPARVRLLGYEWHGMLGHEWQQFGDWKRQAPACVRLIEQAIDYWYRKRPIADVLPPEEGACRLTRWERMRVLWWGVWGCLLGWAGVCLVRFVGPGGQK